MEKVLIVGGAGFIGHHLANLLNKMGIQVTVIDLHYPKNPFSEDIVFVQQDILKSNLDFSQFDYVVHLAAIVGVNRGIVDPCGSIVANYETTRIIADACLESGVPMFFASTSEIYGTNSDVPLSEDSLRVVGPPNNSRWVYSDSKALAERLLISYSKFKGLDVKIGRMFNVAGPNQSASYGMVVPRFVSLASNNEPVTIYGDGSQTRSFCHIEDAISAILNVMMNGESGEVYNIGNPEEVSILDLATLIITRLESQSEIVYIPYEYAYENYVEVYRRVPDISKIKKLGWLPSKTLFDIIDDVIESIR